jgi:3-hydroxybutyrate dehydrogenase
MPTVFITGANRGLGLAFAQSYAGDAWRVIAACREPAKAPALGKLGGDVRTIPLEVTDEARVAALGKELKGEPIDVLINNAGVGGGETVIGSDVARWKRTIDTNLTGMYLVTRQILPLMAEQGRIINLSSVLGRFGVPGYTAYCASKHGVIGFTRALSLETLKKKITVNAIAPGWVDTEMAVLGMTQGATHAKVTFDEFKDRQIGAVPIKRIIDPAEVAGLVTFLCSPEAAAITGQTYNICGGQTMA